MVLNDAQFVFRILHWTNLLSCRITFIVFSCCIVGANLVFALFPPVDQTSGEHEVRPYGTLPNRVGRIVQTFQSVTTHE